jgi:hypothetical protein
MNARQANQAIKEASKADKSTYIRIQANGLIHYGGTEYEVTKARTRKGITQVLSEGRYLHHEKKFINIGWVDCPFSELYHY